MLGARRWSNGWIIGLLGWGVFLAFLSFARIALVLESVFFCAKAWTFASVDFVKLLKLSGFSVLRGAKVPDFCVSWFVCIAKRLGVLSC